MRSYLSIKRCVLFLVVCLLPTFTFGANNYEECEELSKKFQHEWGCQTALIKHANNHPGLSKEVFLECYEKAEAHCHTGMFYCDAILEEIAAKSWLKRRKKWRKKLKRRTENSKPDFYRQIDQLKSEIVKVKASIAFDKSLVIYNQSVDKLNLANVNKHERLRSLTRTNEINEVLGDILTSYQEAETMATEALSILDNAPSFNYKNKKTVKEVIEICQQLSSQIKEEISEQKEITLAQKNDLNKRFKSLQLNSKVCLEKGLERASYDLNKQSLVVAQQIIDHKYDDEIPNLEQAIAAFEKEADGHRLSETINTLSSEEFCVREKERREAFFKQEAFVSKTFIQSLLQNKPYPRAFPLNDLPIKKDGEFLLYIDQLYPFVVQSEKPVSHLCVRVLDQERVVHEETIALPVQKTLSWERYLIQDGLLYIPDTKMKEIFGIDLRLQFVCDLQTPFSMIVSSKSTKPGYRLSVSLEEGPPLYQCNFVQMPPWQLQMLRKPRPLVVNRPLKTSSIESTSLETEIAEKNYTNLESVTFEALDHLVDELGNDPLLIAQYVQNEIAFSDPFMQQEAGVFLAPAAARNPLMTYLDRKGSPWEQCELLVYLLDKAGLSPFYVMGDPCSIPKTVAETMFLTKLPQGETEALVKYPWVMILDSEGKSISICPWMKEMHLIEGYDLYSLMPEEYGSADRWVLKYLKGDENILKHTGQDGNDTAANLFVSFVHEELRKQGLSLEDVGAQTTLVKKQYSKWSEFPRPQFGKKHQVFNHLTLPAPKSYVEVRVFSRDNPGKNIKTSFDLKDLCCSTIPMRFKANEDSSYQLFMGDNKEWSLNLDETDQIINVAVDYFTSSEEKDPTAYSSQTFSMVRGTSAVLYFHFGGPSPYVTEEFFKKFDQEEDETKKVHALLGFIGAAYFDKCGYSEQFLANLHKTKKVSPLGFGLAKLVPDLSKGPFKDQSDLVFPQIDMFHVHAPASHLPNLTGSVEDASISQLQLDTLTIADQSSNEHQILREIFNDPGALSTVSLLQQAHIQQQQKGDEGTGFLVVTPQILEEADKNPEMAQLLYFSHLKDFDLRNFKDTSEHWQALKAWLNSDTPVSDWTYAYLTPGKIFSPDGSYREMGALILSPYAQRALLSNNNFFLNGGLSTMSCGLNNFTRERKPSPLPRLTKSPKGTDEEFCPWKDPWPQNVNDPCPVVRRPDPVYNRPTNNYNWSNPHNHFSNYYNTHNNRAYDFLQVPSYANINIPKQAPFIENFTIQSSDIRPSHKSFMSQVADPIDTITGAFYVDEVDLSLPGPFPLEIRRNYNSQNPIASYLGCGWKFSLNPFLVEQEGKLFAAEMDGTVICYSYNSETSRFEICHEDNPDLYNFSTRGEGGVSNPFHAYIQDNVLYGSDGSKRFFEEGLLKKWVNHQGSSLTFSYVENKLSRIESSTGNFCGFHYGAQGRVSEIYAKDGTRVSYSYNDCDQLVRVVLPNSATITYDYDRSHRIIRETKPHGQMLENIYDDEGRVIEQRSPMGSEQEIITTATFEYSEGCTRVMDGAKSATIYKIFDKQIYKVIDPLGLVTLQSWFIDETSWLNPETGKVIAWNKAGGFLRSLKSFTDKRGLTTTYLYDERGNPTSITLQGEDLTGDGQTFIVKELVYNKYNLPAVQQLAGQKKLIHYDTNFPYLPAKIEVYSQDILVSLTCFEYNSYGFLTKQESNGSVTRWHYNAQGLPCTKIEETGTQDEEIVKTYRYNHQGCCTQISAPSSTVFNTYDIMGNLVESREISPEETLLEACYMGYNLNNQLMWKQTENSSNTIYYDYHSSGELKASWHKVLPSEEMAYTLYAYDKLGYLIEEVDPRGFCTSRTYNALGNVLSETKEGHTTGYTYEKGGFVNSTTSPLGGVSSFVYTTNGLLKEEVYPNNTVKSVVYDIFGRPVTELEDGMTWISVYDDAHKRVVRTHQETGLSEVREFDARGNLIRFKDRAGNTSEKSYDGLGRITLEVSPSGEKTVWNYVGRDVICTFASGESKVQRFAGTRLVQTFVFSSDGELIEEMTADYYPEDSREVIVKGFQTQTSWKNILGLPIKVETGDVTTTYAYDKCGNCISTTDGEGRVVEQEFDGLGRVIKKRLGDGSVLGFAYDLDSNLIEYSLPGGAVWLASYDTMGRKVCEKIQSGNSCFKEWEYTYEGNYLKNARDPMGRDWLYAYDLLGRVAQEKVGEWSRDYAYDPRGLLTCVEQKGPVCYSSWMDSWLSSREARCSKVERSYDENGRLTGESIYLNNNLIQETEQIFSPANRVLKVGNHTREFIYQNGRIAKMYADSVEFNYVYHTGGELIKKQIPNNVCSDIHYNTSARLEMISTHLPDSVHEETFAWDFSGKLSSYVASLNEKQFDYSERGFLKSAGEENYTFDFEKMGTGVCTKAPGRETLSM
ncbi:hypothetical protein COB21_03440, partial [Candidatus Aerophobetes bacterium]